MIQVSLHIHQVTSVGKDKRGTCLIPEIIVFCLLKRNQEIREEKLGCTCDSILVALATKNNHSV